jgi:hypothetical protein
MLAADLVNIVYQLLTGILTGNIGAETLRNTQWSLQTVFIAIPVLIYHLQIARQDQKLGSEVIAARKRVMVITSDKKSPLISTLEQQLGYKVKAVQYVGEAGRGAPAMTDSDIEQLALQVKSSAAEDVVVVLLEGQPVVLPYK